MNALRHGLSYLGVDQNGAADSLEAISAGLWRVRLNRTEMLADVNNLLARGDPNALDRSIKRLAALSRFEVRSSNVRGASARQSVKLGSFCKNGAAVRRRNEAKVAG
jgi:hypothetical protein